MCVIVCVIVCVLQQYIASFGYWFYFPNLRVDQASLVQKTVNLGVKNVLAAEVQRKILVGWFFFFFFFKKKEKKWKRGLKGVMNRREK